MKILGLITARGGSKRVPRKNVKEFLGKPLLAWTIETGKESGVFDRFVLTTDDEEIAEVGKEYGVEVPFMRPAEHATDTAGSLAAVKHAVEWLRDNENYETPWIILLEPTSPGRQVHHLKEVAKTIEERDDLDSITAISELPAHFHPQKVFKMQGDGTVLRNTGKLIRESVARGQDLPTVYFPNSALYAFKSENLFTDPPSLWGDRTLGYVMDEKYALDIDTPDDWVIAEAKMKRLLEGES